MKLWKAILKGSKMKPQAFGDYYVGEGSCALGAAIDGVDSRLPIRWAIFYRTTMACPVCSLISRISSVIIPHLNDEHKWSREAIAEWVKTIEDKQTVSKWEARKLSRSQTANKNLELANETKPKENEALAGVVFR